MSPGTTLVIVSDGVTEAIDEHGEEFGDSRLLGIVQRHRQAKPAELCETIVDAVRVHAPGTAADDLTVMALQRQ
jgi:serine phosphatase RsbU (regulator of sigma subunit)